MASILLLSFFCSAIININNAWSCFCGRTGGMLICFNTGSLSEKPEGVRLMAKLASTA